MRKIALGLLVIAGWPRSSVRRTRFERAVADRKPGSIEL